jgi:hypothetical protein
MPIVHILRYNGSLVTWTVVSWSYLYSLGVERTENTVFKSKSKLCYDRRSVGQSVLQ